MQRILLISVTWVIATPLIAGHLFLGTAAATTFISVTPQDDLKSIIESAANDTTITLSAGTYNLARYAPFNQAVLIQNKTDLILQGQGPGQTILKLPSDAQFGFYTGSNVHNLRIENLQIEGTLPLLTNTHGIGNFTGTTNVTNVTFTNLRVRNTAVGISADTSTAGIFDGVTITNNEILGTVGLDPGWGYGIEVTNPTNVLIADNLIREATRHSVYIARAAPGSNVTVEQNTILNHDPEGAQRATTGRWYLAALAVARASDVDVAFNRIVNSRTIALSVEPDDIFGWPTTDINLVGNEIVDAWYVGMWAITGETHTTLGNSITHYPNPDADGNGWGDLTSFINFPAGVVTSSSFAPPNPRWAEVDFIAEMNGNIFVMHNGMLDSIVPYDSWDYETSPTVWSGTESLTAVPELGDDGLGRLHIVQNGTLYEIHPITWEFTIPGDTNFSSAGDYNANGVVDAADYTVWRDSLGQAGTDLPADGTGDGVVYRLDYDYWKTRFGDSTGDSGAATVPASGTFLFLAWLALLLVGSQPRLSPAR